MTTLLIIVGFCLLPSAYAIARGYRWHHSRRPDSAFHPKRETAEVIEFPKRNRRAA